MMQALLDTIASALRALRANRLRSALTLLGIVIGVLTVIAMSATIEGLHRKIDEDLSMLGTGVFQVQKWPQGGFGNHDRGRFGKRKNFTMADVNLLEQKCTGCLRVAGEAWTFGQKVTAGDKTASSLQLAGGTVWFFDNNGYFRSKGRLFNDAEVSSGADVVVLGSDVADTLFAGQDPLEQRIRIKTRTFRVIGVLEKRGTQLGGGSQDNLIVLPIATFLPLYGDRQSLNVTIQAKDAATMRRTQDEVVGLLRRARGVAPQDENDFELFSNESLQERFEQMTGSIAAATIGLCAISLLVGGIGVMNIMLVSVTERTREIGVRRALGARRRRILAQFLVEAITLTIAGGILGVLLGGFVSFLVRVLVGVPTAVPMWAVAASLITAGGVGLIFGIYPAFRASRLDPVEAMRHE
jgi:putative ABC transport system permease protein